MLEYSRKDGYRDKVRDYQREYQAQYSKTEKGIAYRKKYRASSDTYKDYQRNYRKTDKHKAWRKEYRQRADVKAKEMAYSKAYRVNPEKREARLAKRREYLHGKYHSDVNFRLRVILRSRMYQAIKNDQKAGSAVYDLGCSITDLRAYLESRFAPGMNWDNWSIMDNEADTWHIDHIVPLSSFDLGDREQFLKAAHYTNLQPMWAIDNLVKSDIVAV